MNQKKVSQKFILILLVFVFCHIECYTEQKVQNHFNSIDVDKNGQIDIKEYCKVLRIQDEKDEIFQNQDYYMDLVSLLFQQYDQNRDNQINRQQWVQFAKDIVDESQQGQIDLVQPQIKINSQQNNDQARKQLEL